MAPRVSIPAPTSVKALGGAAARRAYYKVLPRAVKVRAAPSLDAPTLDHKRCGDVLETDGEQSGWVQLVEAFAPSDQRGWVLIDGSVLGVGMLLE
eukprot:202092-Prymnesium_polylepis.1